MVRSKRGSLQGQCTGKPGCRRDEKVLAEHAELAEQKRTMRPRVRSDLNGTRLSGSACSTAW
jgi:hypothetical protein